jgi:hypothetical protein
MEYFNGISSLVTILGVTILLKKALEWYSFHYTARYLRILKEGEENGVSRKLPGLYPSFPDLSLDTQREKATEYQSKFGDLYFVWNLFSPMVILSDPQAVTAYFSSQKTHTRNFGEVRGRGSSFSSSSFLLFRLCKILSSFLCFLCKSSASSFPFFSMTPSHTHRFFFLFQILGHGFSDIMGLMLGASHGDRFQRLHPLFAPFYRDSCVSRDINLIWTTTSQFFQQNFKSSIPSTSECFSLDLGKARFERLPLTILMRLAFGEDITPSELDFIYQLYDSHRFYIFSSQVSLLHL